MKYGTIWITSRIETSGVWVNSGGKFRGEPRLTPSNTKTAKSASVPKLVQF